MSAQSGSSERSRGGGGTPTGAASAAGVPDRDELKRRLTPLQWHVTQEAGTERPFTNEYWRTETPGEYRCVVCDEVLFASGEKFHSACGWPAFSAAKNPGVIAEYSDSSHFMERTEVRCKRCNAHLGHVFDDGPPPTGLRYCINSASIRLVPGEAGGGGTP